MNHRWSFYVLCTFAGFCFASEPYIGCLPKKLYLPKENVMLHNNQIIVGNNTKWIAVNQLYSDHEGLYIMERGKDNAIFQWECPRCGHDNWFWEDVCWVCGYKN